MGDAGAGRWVVRRAIARLWVAAVGGAAVAAAVSVVAGWDGGTLLLLGLCWWVMWRSDAEATQARSSAEDPGRTLVWAVVSLASAFALFASAVLLRRARVVAPDESVGLIALCLASVALSWLLTHTMFSLRYAHLYYARADDAGGLAFPGVEPPDDLDFAYFAFTIGMCFQVSDVAITRRAIRRPVLIHSMLAFAYNTAIVALTLNVFFTLLG
jgi:uncharacterized membrane protein